MKKPLRAPSVEMTAPDFVSPKIAEMACEVAGLEFGKDVILSLDKANTNK
jgi:hypothetical protein